MNSVGTKELDTKRLLLRRFTEQDAPDMFRNWANDPEVTRYLRWQPHTGVEATADLLAAWAKNYGDPNYYHWAIVLKENSQAIGSVGILEVSCGDESGEIGYCLGRAWWGQGLMTEALSAVEAFAFEQVGFNRLEAFHSVNNPGSGRVMQKCGMQFEGTARQKYRASAGAQDCRMYAVLKEDWFSGERPNPAKK